MADLQGARAAGTYVVTLEKRVEKLEEFCTGAYLWIQAASAWMRAWQDGGGEGVQPPKPPPPKPYP